MLGSRLGGLTLRNDRVLCPSVRWSEECFPPGLSSQSNNLLIAHPIPAFRPDHCPHYLTVLPRITSKSTYLYLPPSPGIQTNTERGEQSLAQGHLTCKWGSQNVDPSTLLTIVLHQNLPHGSRSLLASGMVAPKDVPTLVPRACDYVMLHGKR